MQKLHSVEKVKKEKPAEKKPEAKAEAKPEPKFLHKSEPKPEPLLEKPAAKGLFSSLFGKKK